METKKIAVVSSTLWPARRTWIYGSEVENFLLADELGRRGHEVYFYGAAGSEKSPNFTKFGYLPHSETLSYELEWYVVDHYGEDLKEADIVIDMSATMAASEWCKFYTGKPFLATRNGTDLTHPRIRDATRNLVVLSKKVIEVNNGASAAVSPYGIDTDLYTPGSSSERSYYLYLSRPHENKGIGTFIEIARRMPDEKFVMMFPMVTDEQRRFGQQALSNLPPNVEYVAGHDDFDGSKKVQTYRNAKAMIIPLSSSYTEAFGLVFAEAMACGTPFLTNRNSIDQSQWPSQYLIDHTGDVVSAYIERLTNPTFLPAQENRRWVMENYTAKLYGDRYEQLIEKVLGGASW